jgi:hypothetical protein
VGIYGTGVKDQWIIVGTQHLTRFCISDEVLKNVSQLVIARAAEGALRMVSARGHNQRPHSLLKS